ncbi:benzoate/H(+) symporter BenE family transporter [Vreelandella titanicae]|uniref:benzoate/H(+) symporter BenE family transporter n=1 Tax=Vreelandella titanicae TaxID=664683 RepID=UPI003D279DEE
MARRSPGCSPCTCWAALISLFMALRYRQPICGAYTIPGAAILVGSLSVIPFSEAIGAFIMSGLLVLILGVTGLIGRLMRWLPMPIVMAMIAGALIRFATGAVDSVVTAPHHRRSRGAELLPRYSVRQIGTTGAGGWRCWAGPGLRHGPTAAG